MEGIKIDEDSRNIILLGMGLVVFVIFLTKITYTGDWNVIGNNIISLFASLFYTGVCIIYFIRRRDMLAGDVLIGGMIGIGFALIVAILYNNGIWFDTVISAPNTLTDYQTLTVVGWLIIGFIKGVLFNE